MMICVLPTKHENSSMNHRTRCMMGTLPLRGTFSQSQKLKRCGGFFLMSLVLLWQFIWIGKLLLHWCYEKKKVKRKNQTNEQNKKYFSHVPVSAMSSFNLIKEFKLVRKKYEKIKMVSMSVFKIKQMCQLPS